MNHTHKKAKKKAVNITLPEDLIAIAKSDGINLSEFIEQRIRKDLLKRKDEKWAADNADAINQRNAYYEKNPLPSEKYGLFKSPRDPS